MLSPDIPNPVGGAIDEDHAALAASCTVGGALATVVGIDGSFSRRVGAQLAVAADGTFAGSLSDGCLERQIAVDLRSIDKPEVRRYGSGSPAIDFRLPCGGGLDILLDPAPDSAACASTLAAVQSRTPASLPLPAPSLLAQRPYIPALRIVAFGEGPELASFENLARAAGIGVEAVAKDALSLGRPGGRAPGDRWTAVLLLFHDHEWEMHLLEEALAGDAFWIGAQGGAPARSARIEALRARGLADAAIERVRSPIGVLPGSRTPQTLALSVLAEIAHEYERLRPAL